MYNCNGKDFTLIPELEPSREKSLLESFLFIKWNSTFPMSSNHKIKLNIITRDMVVGGAERFITHLINNIDKTSFELQLIILDKDKNPNLAPINGIDKSKILSNPYHKNDPKVFHWLGNIMRSADLNISFILRADQIAAICAAIYSLENLIITERGGRIKRMNSGFKKILGKILDKIFVYNQSILAISNSKEGRRTLLNEGVDKRKIKVIPNGIDLDFDNFNHNYDHSGKFNIGFIGRLVPFKNAEIVIRAFKSLTDNNKFQGSLLIAGDGPQKEFLYNLSTDLDLGSRIEFLGEIHDLNKFYSDIDVGVIPSTDEGTESFPNVLLEYWKYQVPVVCSNIQCLQDICIDEKTALFFNPKSKNDLSVVLNELLQSKELRKELTENALRELKEKYTINKVIKKYEEVFKSISQSC